MSSNKRRGRPPIFNDVEMGDVSLRLPTEFIDSVSQLAHKRGESQSSILRRSLFSAADSQWNVRSAACALRVSRDKAKEAYERLDKSLVAVIGQEYLRELRAMEWFGRGTVVFWVNDHGQFVIERAGIEFVMPRLTDDVLSRLGIRGENCPLNDSPSYVEIIGRPIQVCPRPSNVH